MFNSPILKKENWRFAFTVGVCLGWRCCCDGTGSTKDCAGHSAKFPPIANWGEKLLDMQISAGDSLIRVSMKVWMFCVTTLFSLRLTGRVIRSHLFIGTGR